MFARLRHRYFDRQPLPWQFACLMGLPGVLGVALLDQWWQVEPVVVWAVGGTVSVCLLIGMFWAWRVGQALQRIGTGARVLRRSAPSDKMNFPMQFDCAELQRASAGLRRLVDVWRRRQLELLTQTEQLGRRLQVRTHELSTLQDLSIGLASKSELHELIDEALGALEQTMAYSSASVWSRAALQPTAPVVLMGYRQSLDEQTLLPGADLTGMRLSRANLQRYEQVEREGQPLVENRVRQSLLSWLWTLLSDDARTSGLYRGTKAWMAVPLKSREAVMGVLRIDHQEPDYFDEERVRLLMAVGSQTGLAMRHAQLLAQQKEVAVVAERNRIARDLHDAVSQTLFAANVIAGTLARMAAREDNPVFQTIRIQAETLERLNRGALSEMRLLMFELKPDALQQTPLADLLQHAIEALSCRGGVHIEQSLMREDTLPSQARIPLYRIAQEALSNVARHSGAQHAFVEWSINPDGHGGRLRIADDGCGFDTSQPHPGHFGLGNMAERAAEIGAVCTITSAPGEGTEIRLEFQGRPVAGRTA